MLVKIHHIKLVNDDRVKAVFSFVLGENELALHDVKLVHIGDRLFLAMPCRQVSGKWRDTIHPISKALRAKMENLAIEVYRKHIDNGGMTDEQSNCSSEPKGRRGENNDNAEHRCGTCETGQKGSAD